MARLGTEPLTQNNNKRGNLFNIDLRENGKFPLAGPAPHQGSALLLATFRRRETEEGLRQTDVIIQTSF